MSRHRATTRPAKPRHGVGGARFAHRQGAGRGARGRWARGARGVRSATRPSGLRHGAGQVATRPRAHGLGAACACGLDQIGCLVHLTQFDSVFGLSTVPESIFGHYS